MLDSPAKRRKSSFFSGAERMISSIANNHTPVVLCAIGNVVHDRPISRGKFGDFVRRHYDT